MKFLPIVKPLILLGVLASTCRAQAVSISRVYRVQPAGGVPAAPGAPGEMQIEVKQPGAISEFGQGYWFGSMGELTATTVAPGGQQIVQKMGAPWASAEPLKGQAAAGIWKLKLSEARAGATARADWWELSITTQRPPEMKMPITGRAAPELAALDTALVSFMEERGIEAATLAVVKDGRLVLKRGYGWQDRELTRPISPEAVLRLGSTTKPLIATAIRRLIAEGKLGEDDKALPLLDIAPPAGQKLGDERWHDVTIRQLLEHKSGLAQTWADSSLVRKKLGLDRVALRDDIISYMMLQPLLFAPGEKNSYSNLGYAVLAVLIERATGVPYEDYIRDQIALPIGARSMRLGKQLRGEQLPDEAWFAEENMAPACWDENLRLPDAYAADFTTGMASGSMLSSAEDYCRFMRFYFLDGHLKPASLRDVEWNYQHNGALQGCMALVKQKIKDGQSLDYCVLLNKRRAEHNEDFEALGNALDKALSGVVQWPAVDLWGQR